MPVVTGVTVGTAARNKLRPRDTVGRHRARQALDMVEQDGHLWLTCDRLLCVAQRLLKRNLLVSGSIAAATCALKSLRIDDVNTPASLVDQAS